VEVDGLFLVLALEKAAIGSLRREDREADSIHDSRFYLLGQSFVLANDRAQ